ncbi:MAG: HAD family hydrolase [Pseudomonadota bacterium]
MASSAAATGRAIRGVLFDKDGTLFDFHATWDGWCAQLIADLAGGDTALTARLAEALAFDRAAATLRPESPVIAGTPVEVVDHLLPLLPLLPGWEARALVEHIVESSLSAPLSAAVPLDALMARLRAAELILGVATNDAEAAARAQLDAAGIEDAMSFVAGSDSGHGAKPDPGMLHAFCHSAGLAPAAVAMVGDSTHDLLAGAAAGMCCVGVLTGAAAAEVLSPHADVVLPDIGHLPAWLGLDLSPPT